MDEPKSIQWIPAPEERHAEKTGADDALYFSDEWRTIQDVRELATRLLREGGLTEGDCSDLIASLETMGQGAEYLRKELRFRRPERLDWCPVTGIAPEIWEKITGHRMPDDEDAEGNRENSELGVCCANISAARDLLLKCRANNGLTREDVESLRTQLTNHETATTFHHIYEVLSQLDIRL